ncbi:MAG: TIGR04376 family protein, partial [Microcystis panniformis]
FRQGNQLWGRMEGVKKRLTQSQELLQQVQQRRQEVQIKAEKAPKNQSRDWETTFWAQPQESDYQRSNYDNLDLKFKEWEMEEELKKLKREMGR